MAGGAVAGGAMAGDAEENKAARRLSRRRASVAVQALEGGGLVSILAAVLVLAAEAQSMQWVKAEASRRAARSRPARRQAARLRQLTIRTIETAVACPTAAPVAYRYPTH